MDRVHSGLTASIPTGSALAALLARLEAADVGSVELDAAMIEAFPPTNLDEALTPWHVTRSLDAALALAERVFPGELFWNLSHGSIINGKRMYWAEIIPPDEDPHPVRDALAPSPALALCAAVLKAKTARYEPQANEPNQSQHKGAGE